jgi:preprotein translocase subunit SecA
MSIGIELAPSIMESSNLQFKGAAKVAENDAETSTSRSEKKVVGSDGKEVGRNDLCPCGSGKKYKKCHGK